MGKRTHLRERKRSMSRDRRGGEFRYGHRRARPRRRIPAGGAAPSRGGGGGALGAGDGDRRHGFGEEVRRRDRSLEGERGGVEERVRGRRERSERVAKRMRWTGIDEISAVRFGGPGVMG